MECRRKNNKDYSTTTPQDVSVTSILFYFHADDRKGLRDASVVDPLIKPRFMCIQLLFTKIIYENLFFFSSDQKINKTLYPIMYTEQTQERDVLSRRVGVCATECTTGTTIAGRHVAQTL
jgi:hypothetical protein|uniref:Uncharacterized protein n=1 Tax=Sipha flava TaxID=143950 RepID=A0A2S2R0X6_9HEMI